MLESGLRDILVVDGEESVYHAEQAQAGLDTIGALSFPLVEEKSGNVDSRVIAQRRCAIGEGRPGSRRGQRDFVHEGGDRCGKRFYSVKKEGGFSTPTPGHSALLGRSDQNAPGKSSLAQFQLV